MSNEVFNFTLDSPYEEEISYLTLVSEGESGKEQRYQKWLRPRRTFRLKLDARGVAETDQIWRFYTRHKGAANTFLFENPNENPVSNETIGSGDGSKTVFYVGGSVDAITGDLILAPSSITVQRKIGSTGDWLAFTSYTIDEPIGQLTMNSPPSVGDVFRANYEFYYRVRFKDDPLTREAFAADLWRFGVELVESL